MVNSAGSKSRILFLRSWLLDHTDDDHALTTEEIISVCRENGYGVQQATVGDDMAALVSSGLDVIRDTVYVNRTMMNAYHVGA